MTAERMLKVLSELLRTITVGKIGRDVVGVGVDFADPILIYNDYWLFKYNKFDGNTLSSN